MRDPQAPPDLPGVGEHLPDVAYLDPRKGLLAGIVQDDRHLLDPRAQAVSQGQKLDIESVTLDLPYLDDLADQVALIDLDAGLGVVTGQAKEDLEHYEIAEGYEFS